MLEDHLVGSHTDCASALSTRGLPFAFNFLLEFTAWPVAANFERRVPFQLMFFGYCDISEKH